MQQHYSRWATWTNFKILETNKRNICGGVGFRIVIGGWIGQFKFFKRNATKDIFLIIYQNFRNISFSNIPWKIFFSRYSDILDCRAVALKKMWQLQNFRTLFPFWALPECICSAILTLVVGCRLYSCNCIKRSPTTYLFLIIFQKFWRISNNFMKSSVTEFSRVLGCRL